MDVFFVISGFLITSIIINDIEKNKFNLFQFYGRRLVRLYPALLVAVALTFVAGFILADPKFLETIARSGKYAIGSMSNIFFSKNLGYFDTAASQQPFLHTWTLGVEWQFYLITPILIWLLLKHSKEALITGLALVVGISLVLSQTKVQASPDKAYYLVAYRAFELGIGSLLVFLYAKGCSRLISVLMTITGLCMIVTAGIIYTPQTPFPGYAALLPTIGAALCIYGGRGFIKGNVLILPPVVYLGKISYSVYLVHWPLIVFWKYVLVFRDITIYDKLAILVLSLILGFLLYRLVETKVTWKRLRNKAIGCVVIIVIGLLLVVGANWVQKHIDVLNWRLNETVYSNQSIFNDKEYLLRGLYGELTTEPSFLIIGDSIASNYFIGLDHELQNKNISFKVIWHGGCYMLDDAFYFNYKEEWRLSGCDKTYLLSEGAVHDSHIPIIYTLEWLYKHDLINRATKERILFDARSKEYRDFIHDRLVMLRQRFGHRQLILIGSAPYIMSDEERLTGVRKSCSDRPTFLIDICGMSEGKDYPVQESEAWHINQMIREFAQTHPNTYYIDPSPVICPDGVCNTRRNDEFYRPNDINHFSVEGSYKVSPYIWAEIEKILDE